MEKVRGAMRHRASAIALAIVWGSMTFEVGATYETTRGANVGGLQLNWTNRFAAGVAMRTQSRDYRLVDKQNNPANWNIYHEAYDYGVITLDFSQPNPFIEEARTQPAGFFNLCSRPDGAWAAFYTNGPLFLPPGQAAGQPVVPPSFVNIGDCMTQTGDPQPSRQLLNAPGGFNINGDDGNLNYDKGDVTYANIRIRSELSGAWRNLSFKIGGMAYHDPVNDPSNHPRAGSGFRTHLADRPIIELPGRTQNPGYRGIPVDALPTIGNSAFTTTIDRSSRAERPDHVATQFSDLRLMEAYLSAVVPVAGREMVLTAGNQYLRWGESTFTVFNTLNAVNPLSAILWRQPGAEVRDAFLPVGMVTANMSLTDRFGFEVFYQYDWKPTEPDVCGSFLSVSDVAGCGRGETPIYLGMGNAPEAPLGEWQAGGIAGTQTNTSRTIYLEDERHGYPQNGKQFGLRLDYYADLFGGTELSFYGMNIHSRLPYYSVYAACEYQYEEGTCPRLPPIPEGTDATVAQSMRQYRVDSMGAFLDYPEDVRLFGLSATTTLGDWSFAGEFSYSPNQPAQVSVVDVTYAGVQPAFEPPNFDGPYDDRMNVIRTGDAWPPNSRVSVPDYLVSRYRSGCGNDWACERDASMAIEPGQYIPGFERLKVGQLALTGIRMLSGSNPIGADQILFVGELAAIRVFDMPPLHELQFQGSGAYQTHYSQGQADYDEAIHGLVLVGTPGSPLNYQRLAGPTDRFNPERADPDIFADDFAWGYRVRVDATYNDLFWGIGIMPRVQLYHDVRGTSISPGQDFVHGRKEWTLSNDFIFNQNFSTQLRYVIFHGAGDRNLRGDRNYAEVSLSYAF
jgi:hypothetical protein